jgi:hypothetical protein
MEEEQPDVRDLDPAPHRDRGMTQLVCQEKKQERRERNERAGDAAGLVEKPWQS